MEQNESMEQAVSKAKSELDKLKGYIAEVTKTVRETIRECANKDLAGLNSELKRLGETIYKATAPAIKEAASQGKKFVSQLVSAVSSSGLDTAAEKIKTKIRQLGTAVNNVAKSVLPIFTGALKLLVNNLDGILPLVSGVFAAIKTWNILSTIAPLIKGIKTAWEAATVALAAHEAAQRLTLVTTLGGTTLMETAVALLTGKITLAEAAQWAWNAAMNAHPAVLFISLLVGLTIAIGGWLSAVNKQKSAEERLAEANEQLGESFDGVGTAAQDFISEIESAESYLSSFNNLMFASSEEQQELQKNMEEVQNGITSICRKASEERRDYTDEEKQKLDEYFARLKELNQQQLDMEAARAEAVRQQAVTAAEAHTGSLEEYQQLAQEWIKTAQDQAEQQKQILEEQTITEIALLNQRYGEEANLANEEYKLKYDNIIKEKEKNLAAIQSEVAQVSAAYQQGYLERAGDLEEWLIQKSAISQQEEERTNLHNSIMAEAEEKYNREMERINNDLTMHEGEAIHQREKALEEFQNTTMNEEQRYTEDMANLRSQFNEGFDESVQEQLGTWMAMLEQTKLYGGDIGDENQKMVNAIFDEYERLPDEAKGTMKEFMDGMVKGIVEKESALMNKVVQVGKNVLSNLNKTFDINSPSKKTRKIFRGVIEGGEVGIDAEKPKLLQKADAAAQETLEKLQGGSPVNRLAQRLRAGVLGSFLAPVQAAAAWGEYRAGGMGAAAAAAQAKAGQAAGTVETHIQIDGREFAVVTSPYISKELAFHS